MSLPFLESVYADFLRNPDSIEGSWQRVFSSLLPDGRREGDQARAAARQERLDRLSRAYRVLGHRAAYINPLAEPPTALADLEPARYGLQEEDLDAPLGESTIRRQIERLRNTYCRSIGVQFMHIEGPAAGWLQERMESCENRIELSREQRLKMLERLSVASVFEQFLQKKFIGSKTFSLEGCESLIPLLDLAFEEAASEGVREIVIGMAHRGRLNVMANVVGQPLVELLRMFVKGLPNGHAGDVQYHQGFSGDLRAGGRELHVSLTFNPSHLEFVGPVVMGRVRAKQDRASDGGRRRCLGVLIHGDAAFAGEGVVQESLNLSGLEAYRTGGTLHIIVNNQIGFTTPPAEGRSSLYATDVARMLQVPIFHVNGEDPEAVAHVVRLAMSFRSTFRRDAIIDLYGYRRRGHNEGDDPAFTQPLMVRRIESRKPVWEQYLQRLSGKDGISTDTAERLRGDARARLEQALTEARSLSRPPARRPAGAWADYRGGPEDDSEEIDSAVPRQDLSRWLKSLAGLPDGFQPHPRIRAGLDSRRRMAEAEEPLDWSAAEALAFASLAAQGVRVRLAGQDSARGTFSQRHAVLFDRRDGRAYCPLQHVQDGQAPVEILNSPLCEAAALAYEYGYSLDFPDALVLWEAQYGDFCNAAQVIVDQFLSSAEAKWRRLSGLTLLLPHGLEGTGPEHASARPERFLSLAAQDNIQIVCPSTPAQYFHCLRRQALRRWRKPLVVLTPKSLLRRRESFSALEELASGSFQRALPDARAPGTETRRVLLCSGKIYYELIRGREEHGHRDVAIARLEQLYPLREQTLRSVLDAYPPSLPIAWVQEECENMGAWPALRFRFANELLGHPFSGVHRPASPCPAEAGEAAHRQSQQELIRRAFEEK